MGSEILSMKFRHFKKLTNGQWECVRDDTGEYKKGQIVSSKQAADAVHYVEEHMGVKVKDVEEVWQF